MENLLKFKNEETARQFLKDTLNKSFGPAHPNTVHAFLRRASGKKKLRITDCDTKFHYCGGVDSTQESKTVTQITLHSNLCEDYLSCLYSGSVPHSNHPEHKRVSSMVKDVLESQDAIWKHLEGGHIGWIRSEMHQTLFPSILDALMIQYRKDCNECRKLYEERRVGK